MRVSRFEGLWFRASGPELLRILNPSKILNPQRPLDLQGMEHYRMAKAAMKQLGLQALQVTSKSRCFKLLLL